MSYRPRTALLLFLSTALALSAAEPKNLPAGPSAFLQKISGAVSLAASAQAKPEPLSEQDTGRALTTGQIVHVGDGGALDLRLASGALSFSEPGDFTIPAPANAKKNAAMQVLFHYLFPVGQSIPAVSSIFSPAPGGAVQAGTFAMKWDPRQWSGALTLRLSDEMGTELWAKAGIPSEAGAFESADARQRLADARRPTEQRTLVFTISSEEGVAIPVRFRLFSQTDEKRIQAALAQWDKEMDDWPRAAGHAAIFLEAHLFNDAETAAEAALAAAPASTALRLALAEIERRIGRQSRVEELTAEPQK